MFVLFCILSPVILPTAAVALLVRAVSLSTLVNDLRIIFLWPAYWAYTLVFVEFELEDDREPG